MICIEPNKNRIVQTLALDGTFDRQVVLISFGQWFPEDGFGVFG
jgi:hypothetical protein